MAEPGLREKDALETVRHLHDRVDAQNARLGNRIKHKWKLGFEKRAVKKERKTEEEEEQVLVVVSSSSSSSSSSSRSTRMNIHSNKKRML